jgi:hypothetical protein
VIPAYGVFVCLFCLPTWIEDYRKPKFIAGATLLQANNFVYILNGVLIFFYCSHYSISTAGRQLLTLNNLNMAFKRWTSGDSPLLPVLYNFFLCTVFFEIHCYNMNREKVKLFLKKEKCKQKERQKQAILQNIPTNVLVLRDNKVVFKNKHADSLIENICKETLVER